MEKDLSVNSVLTNIMHKDQGHTSFTLMGIFHMWGNVTIFKKDLAWGMETSPQKIVFKGGNPLTAGLILIFFK